MFSIVALQCCLLAGAAVSAAAPFRFDNPGNPQFSAAEKQAQRERGAGVVPRVRAAYQRGDAVVVLPPGDYRFGLEHWGPQGVVYALEFRGLKRDAEHPLRIVAEGATFWFDLPPDQVPHAHFAMGFVACSHITLEGAALDRDPQPVRLTACANITLRGNRVLASGRAIPPAASTDSSVVSTDEHCKHILCDH